MHGSLASITIRLVLTLINRGALSLKKAADVSNGLNSGWSMGHFSTLKFPPTPAQRSDDPLKTRFYSHDDIPLDELDQHARLQR